MNEDEVPIYGTALMASDSPGVEQKPHDGDNQVTILVDSGASDNYISSEEMLRDVRDYTAALDFNIDIPAGRGESIQRIAARGSLALWESYA